MEVIKVTEDPQLQSLLGQGQPFLAELPFPLYQSIPAANFSGLKSVAKSPRHYQWAKANPAEPAAALTFGSAFHALMEGPAAFEAAVVCRPKFDMRKKVDKEAAAAWDEANAGKLTLNEEDMDALQAIAKVCEDKAKLRNIQRGAAREVTGYYTHPEIDVACKFRADLARPEGILVDYKTTVDASEDAFKWAARKFSYHMQAAFYLDGMTFCTGVPYRDFIIVAVEKNPPYDLAIYHLDERDVARGREEYMEALKVYKTCSQRNVWPGYPDEIKRLQIFYHKE